MDTILDNILEAKFDRLSEWKHRYNSMEYPEKIALNLLYDGLTLLIIWDEFVQEIRNAEIRNEVVQSPIDEVVYILSEMRNKAQFEFVRPTLLDKFQEVRKVNSLDFTTFRLTYAKASAGSAVALEETEYTYVFYTAAYEAIYYWLAYRLKGENHRKAFQGISGMQIGNIDYANLDSLVDGFGHAVSVLYNLHKLAKNIK
jgi:hypothetical protein